LLVVSVQCPQCDHPVRPEAVSSGVCARCGASLAAIPALDASKLARLDEVTAAPPRLPHPAAQPGGRSIGPPGDPFVPPQTGPINPLVSQAFAPPPEAGMQSEDVELGVERSTRAIRLDARLRAQASEPPLAVSRVPTRRPAAAPEPAAPRRSMGGLVIAVVLIAAVAVAVAALVLRG
jgi:hypothetical protein